MQNNIKVNMERGWPCKEQLQLSMPMLDLVRSETNLELECDYRGYAGTGGIEPIKKIFSEIMQVQDSQIYIGSTMSTTLMFDIVFRAMYLGLNGHEAWSRQGKIKFICPAPGYEKHFKICEMLGIEMVPVAIDEQQVDIDKIEQLVAEDLSIKGIWCVPLYSNPTGTIYSDEVISRLATMKAADDFRIFWDNAYVVHHLTEEKIEIKDIIEECESADNINRVFEFFSTSKITFPGGGVAGCASSVENIKWLKKTMLLQLKSGDKINEYRHALFLKNKENVLKHMEKHRKIIKPKFDMIDEMLKDKFHNKELVEWNNPKGGYFVNLKLQPYQATRVYNYCGENGVLITPSGSTFPYGRDTYDQFIRLAPTYPTIDELEYAIEILCKAIENR